jgi:hypothetical protein
MTPPSEHLQRRRFDPRPQNLCRLSRVMMSALRPRMREVCSFTSINSKRPSLPFFVVEEEINVGILARLAARRRAEQIEMLNPKLPQLGLMLS